MTTATTNRDLAERFREAAKILDLVGANAFKAIAFQKVASVFDNLPEEAAALYASGGRAAVEALKGIGASSATIIVDVIETGESSDLDELAAQVPPDVLAMLDVPGLGPKTVGLVWREMGIESFTALSAAIEDGSLATLKGLGPKKLEQIREGLTMREAAARRRSLGEAVKIGNALMERLGNIEGVERVVPAGSVRRGRETIGDLDFVVTSAPQADPRRILETFSRFEPVQKVLGLGITKCSVVTGDGLQVDVRVVPRASFGAALCYFTGSKEHNKRLRALAAQRDLSLTEWGLFEAAAWKSRDAAPGTLPSLEPVAGETEASVYAALGLAWVPPELREDAGEIELAMDGALPALIEASDYRGDLHCHTLASDGTGTIDEMAEAAKALGYEYLAITDHSASQRQANGLDAERLLAHALAVREANERIEGIELLAGTECDILGDGRLDYDDAVLAELDWVVASPHVALRQDPRAATNRLLRAIDNPYVNLVGHPTGRLINARAGLPLDFTAVFAAAAANGTALEINASYQRLDLAADRARAAVRAGCKLAIDTDAHTPRGLGKLEGGLVTARRGWVGPGDVVNCLSLRGLREFVAAKRP